MLRTTSVSEQEALLTTPPVTVTPRKETKAERRYDAKTVEEAVALAARMQTEHQETLSLEELETIAAEAGIRPEFMRRALAQLETRTTEKTTRETIRETTQLRRTKAFRKRARGLSAERLGLMFGLPVAYCIALFPIVLAILPQYDWVHEAGLWSFIGLSPGLLALVTGAVLGRKRQGVLAGAWLGGLVTLTVSLADMLHTGASEITTPLSIFAAFIGAGAALGLFGGALPALSEMVRGGDAPDDEEWGIK